MPEALTPEECLPLSSHPSTHTHTPNLTGWLKPHQGHKAAARNQTSVSCPLTSKLLRVGVEGRSQSQMMTETACVENTSLSQDKGQAQGTTCSELWACQSAASKALKQLSAAAARQAASLPPAPTVLELPASRWAHPHPAPGFACLWALRTAPLLPSP